MSAHDDRLELGRRTSSSPKPPRTRLALASRALLGIAACLWLVAVVLEPTTRGIGAALPAHKLADLIGSATIADGVPRIMGPIWYLMPIGAAIMLGTLGLAGRIAVMIRFGAGFLAAASAVGFTVFLTKLHFTNLGPASWCAVGGAALVLVAVVIEGASLLPAGRIENVL